MARSIKIILLCCIVFGVAAAQSSVADASIDRMKEDIEKMEQNGYFAGYFSPIISTLGTGVINGLWKDANMSGTGLKLYIGAEVMTVLIPASLLLFDTPSPFDSLTNVKTATIFGNKKAYVEDPETKFVASPFLPGLIPSAGAFLPLAAPQVTIGKVFGTSVSGRFLLLPDIAKLGEKFKLEGDRSIMLYAGGVAHSISQYIPAAPLDIALAFSYGNVNFLDMITSTATAVDLNVGKKLPFLNAMVGVGWEKSAGSVKFDVPDELFGLDESGESLNLALDESEIEGLTQIHANVGLTLKLAFFSMHTVFHAGKQLSVSSGIGIEF